MSDRSSYAFMLEPRWLVGHLVVVVAVIAFVNLGLWQVRRLDERRDFNAVVSARLEAAPAALSNALDPAADEWQAVEVTGTYLPTEEVILQARSNRGRSGHEVLTPLDTGDQVVMVNRGWVPIDVAGPPALGAEPPDGIVRVVGLLRRTEVKGAFGPTDPPAGELDRISRVDLERLQPQIDMPLAPMWIQLTGQDPAPTEFPVIQPLPSLTEGPHLSYAVQWFIFAAVVTVSYPFLLRRTASRTPVAGSSVEDER